MAKNIVLLSDGTADSESGVVFTNIAKLHKTLEDLKDPGQFVFYDAGVGASGGALRRGFAQLTGEGIRQNIIDLYRQLVLQYEPGDNIFLFGFSRGATTVRSLAGMIRKVGILHKDNLGLIEEAYRLYNERVEGDDVDRKDVADFRQKNSYFDRKDDGTDDLKDDVFIKFLGVFDTVEALGFPGLPEMNKKWFGFHDLRLSRMVKVARHALSLDEHREDFEPTPWIPYKKEIIGKDGAVTIRETDSEQRWFPGVHTDIGGGYEHHELADSTYVWMLAEAANAGLILPRHYLDVDRHPEYISDDAKSDDGSLSARQIKIAQFKIHPNYLGKLHDSCAGLWRLRSGNARVPGLTLQEHPPKFDECVDETVKKRMAYPLKRYHPPFFTIGGTTIKRHPIELPPEEQERLRPRRPPQPRG